jgi:hypothetical protein
MMRLGVTEIVLIVFLLVFLAGIVVVVVFYLKNLQELLNECNPANRQMPSANVWLMFIPLFNIVYRFIMYPKISESLRLEFESRGATQPGDYLKGLGLGMAITGTLSVIPFQPIRSIGGLAVLILMIIYWVKSAEFKNKLRALPKADGVRISSSSDLLD